MGDPLWFNPWLPAEDRAHEAIQQTAVEEVPEGSTWRMTISSRWPSRTGRGGRDSDGGNRWLPGLPDSNVPVHGNA